MPQISVPWIINLILGKLKVFLILGASSTVTAYLVVLVFVTPQYKAQSTIIPLEQGSQLGTTSLLRGINNIPLSLGGLGSTTQQLDLFLTILNSRTTLTEFITKFDLKKKLKIKRTEDALKRVRKLVSVGKTKEDALVVTAIDTSPAVAAEMCNHLVGYLNAKVIDLNMAKARANKEFLAKRFEDIRHDLEAAEDTLAGFQRLNNIVELKSQVGASVESYARIEAELYLKQVERSILAQYLSEDAPQLKLVDIELRETARKLQQIKSGRGDGGVLYPLQQLPTKAKQYLRLERDVFVYTSLGQVVLPLLEQAKYDEQKSIPVIQVIDKAVPPDKRFFPKRTITAVSAGSIICIVYLLMLIAGEIIPAVSSPSWVALLTRLRLR